jgi:hypothetical protein
MSQYGDDVAIATRTTHVINVIGMEDCIDMSKVEESKRARSFTTPEMSDEIRAAAELGSIGGASRRSLYT